MNFQTRISPRHWRFWLPAGVVVATFLVGVPSLGYGQGMSKDDPRAQYAVLGQQLQKVGMELQGIQKKALAKNPKLEKDQKKLRKLVSAAMKKAGVDPEKEMAEASEARAALADQSLSEEKKRGLLTTMEQKIQRLQEAQMKALQKPEVKKFRDAFQKKMEAAMIKTDPKAKKLLAEFESLQKKMEKIRMAK